MISPQKEATFKVDSIEVNVEIESLVLAVMMSIINLKNKGPPFLTSGMLMTF